MSLRRLNLRGKEHFPTFSALRPDDSFDPFNVDCPLEPDKHWCLLVEIIEPIPYFRPMWKVKDKENKEFIVVFYFDNGVVTPKSWEKTCRPGGVMAIMYTESHCFRDGQIGIRAEDVHNIKMIPCSLNALLRIGDELNKPASTLATCGSCKRPAPLQCSSCSVVKYCGKDCQASDWKLRHKHECAAVQQVREWKTRDWQNLDEYWLD